MNKSIYLQIFVFAIMVAFLGSFNAYAQDVSTGKLPQKYIDKLQGQTLPGTKANAQNNYGDMLATFGFTWGGQTGNMEDITLPGGVISTLFPWAGATAYVSGMTYNPITALYYIVDVGDTVWTWDGSATPPALFDILAAPLGPNGIAYNPADGLTYLCTWS